MISPLRERARTWVFAPPLESRPHEVRYFITPDVTLGEKLACAALKSGLTVFRDIIAGQDGTTIPDRSF